ncbi:MAG: hypothetical protein ACX94A_05435, partial [Algiphilus sp.]
MKRPLSCIVLCGCLAACGSAPNNDNTQSPSEQRPPEREQAWAQPSRPTGNTLTEAEMRAMAPPADAPNAVQSLPAPDGPMLTLYNESAYQTDADTWMIDVLAGTPAYITAQLLDAAGEPV